MTVTVARRLLLASLIIPATLGRKCLSLQALGARNASGTFSSHMHDNMRIPQEALGEAIGTKVRRVTSSQMKSG